MPVIIISVNPIIYLISYLCACVRYLEINNIINDSVYYYSYSINNYDKEKSLFKYFSFVEDIGISFFKKDNTISYLFEQNNITKGHSVINNYNLSIDTYKLVFKHKWPDPIISSFFHSIRVYSNGVIIHNNRLFKFIYRIDDNGNLTRREL